MNSTGNSGFVGSEYEGIKYFYTFLHGGIDFNYDKLTLAIICIHISELAHN